jgi:hypothetical protein
MNETTTVAELAAEMTRLNEIGASSGNRRTDSEFYHTHALSSVPTEHREAFARWLRRHAPATALTATSTLTAPDANGIPAPVLTAWLARLPADAVVVRESEEPLTLRATWTETR